MDMSASTIKTLNKKTNSLLMQRFIWVFINQTSSYNQ